MKNFLESECNKYLKCDSCPLLIKKVRVSDPDYDYHDITICYKKEYDKIHEIYENIQKDYIEYRKKELRKLTKNELIIYIKNNYYAYGSESDEFKLELIKSTREQLINFIINNIADNKF